MLYIKRTFSNGRPFVFSYVSYLSAYFVVKEKSIIFAINL